MKTFKICTKCKVKYPKSKKYFFKKSQNRNGLRAICKKCHKEDAVERKIQNRCKEEGILRSEWEEFKRKKLLERDIFQFKDERLKYYPRPLRARILRKIRNGYNFTTLEQYYKDDQRGKKNRKYNYKNNGKITRSDILENLPDYYVAGLLRKKVGDIPKEIIETKRLIVKIRREINHGG